MHALLACSPAFVDSYFDLKKCAVCVLKYSDLLVMIKKRLLSVNARAYLACNCVVRQHLSLFSAFMYLYKKYAYIFTMFGWLGEARDLKNYIS